MIQAFWRVIQQRRMEPDVISSSSAINSCENGGQREKALQLLDEMQLRRLEQDLISFSGGLSFESHCISSPP